MNIPQQQKSPFMNGNANPELIYNNLLRAYSSQSPQIDVERDKKRIDVLLQINTILLQKCIMLQLYVLNRLNVNALDYNQKKDMYQNYLKRIHFNLTCLASINDIHSAPQNAVKKNYVLPQIVLPPLELSELNEYYRALDQLYPEAVPLFQKRVELLGQQQRMRAQAQGIQGQAASPHSKPQVQSPKSAQNLSGGQFSQSPSQQYSMPNGQKHQQDQQEQQRQQFNAFVQHNPSVQVPSQKPQMAQQMPQQQQQQPVQQQMPQQQLSQQQMSQQQMYRQFLQQQQKQQATRAQNIGQQTSPSMNGSQQEFSSFNGRPATGTPQPPQQSFQFLNENYPNSNVSSQQRQDKQQNFNNMQQSSALNGSVGIDTGSPAVSNAGGSVLSPEQILARANSIGTESNGNGGASLGNISGLPSGFFDGWQ
ncbi:hypothetical protein FOA43_000632 [Brettanomyces nanus]|uniref:Uncharacterized protein n=1 Tax=Eeniella nana TaxID=13502 RepID=A0A875RZK7_EENNA|nr:uncharacterized protein FOA43_000632 [Brettanomyces nanus]QPG73322.1 hypothetical protein FOA43_000632 [Brettanomyces nanus]